MRVHRVEEIGRMVQNARHLRELTQAEVAERAGVSRQLVARLEAGTGTTTLANLWSVAQALEIDLDLSPRQPENALFGWSESEPDGTLMQKISYDELRALVSASVPGTEAFRHLRTQPDGEAP